MTVRLVLTSCDNPDEGFTFDHATVLEAIGACMAELAAQEIGISPPEVADLLDTIAAAIRRHDEGNPPIARHWDFSSPESAFYVLFFEDSGDDDGTPAHVIWERARDMAADQSEVIAAVAPVGWDSVDA